MKNIFKYLSVLCAALSLLLLVSCPNPLELVNISSGAKSGITIIISGEGVGARTLFPSAPNFTKFEISFENINGQNTYNTIVLDDGKSEVTIDDLPVDTTWKITVKGFITINGNFIQAADGEATIDVLLWINGKTTFQSVNIPINARQKKGENGTFHYDINFPGSVNTAELFIYDIGGSPWDVYDKNVTTPLGENEPVDMLNNKSGSFSLEPGYYMMTMKFNNGYKAVAWTEVIHIYSNTVTEMFKVFDESLILGIITLSGKASILIDGVKPDRASVYIYSDAKYTNLFNYTEAKYGSKENAENTGELFPISMPAFDEPITFYLKINAEIGSSFYSRELGFFKLYKDDYVFNINENFETITLSGTSDVKINGYNPREVNIFAYRADNDELLTVNAAKVDLGSGKNGSWKMTFESFKSQIQVYFIVEAISMNYSHYYKRADITVNAFKTNIADIFIEMDVGLLTVSGTANITVNGASAKYAGITMRKVTFDNNNEETIGDFLDHYEIDYSIGNTFVLSIDYLNSPIQVYFDYRCIDVNGNYMEGTFIQPHLTLNNANITGVNLNVNINMVNLGGTANIIINDAPAQWAFVNMYRTSDKVQIGYSEIDLRTYIYNDQGEQLNNPNYKRWNIIINPPFTENTSVYFVVSGEDSENEYFEKNVLTMNVFNQSNRNITLDVNITDITLSGTVTIAHGFKPPSGDVEIIALADTRRIGDTTVSSTTGQKNWTINIKSFSASTTVRFMLRWTISGETFSYFPSETADVYESNVSGIGLGNRTLNPSYPFEDTGSEPKWTAYVNPSWLFSGEKVTAGEYYALDFTLTTQYAITDLDAVLRDLTLCECEGSVHACYEDSVLSDVRRVESNRNAASSLTGTIVFAINKSASSTDHLANSLYFMVPGTTGSRPTLTFSNLEIRKLTKEGSVEAWPIKVNGKDDILTVVGPGITTTAEIGDGNVLLVKPGEGGYYHFVLEYDLGREWSNKNVRIEITTEYYLEESTKIAWQVTARPNSTSYPTICGSTSNSLEASTEWRTMTGNNNGDSLFIPAGPGDDGRKLYLSGLQIEGKKARFRNFTMTITEQ